MPLLRLVLLVALVIYNIDVSNGMNIGQYKEVEEDSFSGSRDQTTKNKEGKIGAERNIEVINNVLDHLFENEEEGSAAGNDDQHPDEALKFFISTRTKTLKTTTTYTQSLTSYNTCYKGIRLNYQEYFH